MPISNKSQEQTAKEQLEKDLDIQHTRGLLDFVTWIIDDKVDLVELKGQLEGVLDVKLKG